MRLIDNGLGCSIKKDHISYFVLLKIFFLFKEEKQR